MTCCLRLLHSTPSKLKCSPTIDLGKKSSNMFSVIFLKTVLEFKSTCNCEWLYFCIYCILTMLIVEHNEIVLTPSQFVLYHPSLNSLDDNMDMSSPEKDTMRVRFHSKTHRHHCDTPVPWLILFCCERLLLVYLFVWTLLNYTVFI